MVRTALCTLFAAGAALVAAPNAHAAANAIASIGNVAIALKSLAPWAPSVPQLQGDPLSSHGVQVSIFEQPGAPEIPVLVYGTGLFDPVTVDLGGSSAWAMASVGSPGTLAGLGLSASGSALGAPGAPAAWSAFAAESNVLGYHFLVPSYTQVEITATLSTAAAVSLASDPALEERFEGANAGASMRLWGTGAFGDPLAPQFSFGEAASYARSAFVIDPLACPGLGFCLGPQTASDSRELTLVFVNEAGTSLDAYLDLRVSVSGTGYPGALPVPEPDTWALTLAGLVTVGTAARRRRRQPR